MSNYTANGPVIDNTENSGLPIITHNERDFYVVETEDRGNQQRVLIPLPFLNFYFFSGSQNCSFNSTIPIRSGQ